MDAVKLVLPKMKTKTVWAGVYGGHFNVIVFFSKKPILSKETHRFINGDWYDCLDNKDIIIGDMYWEEFRELFPTANIDEPTDIEIVKVVQIKLTTMWEEYTISGESKFYMRSISCRNNWWR